MTKDTMQIVREQDVVPFRNRVRELSTKIGMSLVNQTKLITAASELVRNMLKYANGGKVMLETVSKNAQSGIRLIFMDQGPGITNVQQAMQDGFSTGKSLGLGLPGAKRLVNEFDINSIPGEGTTVTIIHWKHGR
ncbi:anti-sigma regulatory factor [Pontibacter anaerobius]|uniref:Anti-sigma regulatory factor n=1 Tax=Pontibacter anaerobius TaxID=2993940 RepID=A0ABT3RFH7_9BACT|nr:anti-sigma regulatory factor [Pontibacter anaerobius]MCX2740223.1 anti-sigma regulatory factor [Pontibacter anaerobius]